MDSSIVAQISVKVIKPPAKYKLVRGVGINDSTNPVWTEGRTTKTYQTWSGMLTRCYSACYQVRQQTYIGCTVDADWLRFSEFERWMLTQNYEGKELDKDILFPGNKVYSAATCVFVPKALNSLLTARQACRGAYPLGVSYHKGSGLYQSQACRGGTQVNLGYYQTPAKAHRAWQLDKAETIACFPAEDACVRTALAVRAAKIREDAANGRITEVI